MSDIPKARAILEQVLRSNDVAFIHRYVRMARDLLDRQKPEFVARAILPKLTDEQAFQVLELRDQGLPIHEICRKMNIRNHGRASEVWTDPKWEHVRQQYAIARRHPQ